MTWTPFMLLILAGYGPLLGTLGFVSIWSRGGDR
jgi:hypothetical protein